MHRDLLGGYYSNLRRDVVWIKVVSVDTGGVVNVGYLLQVKPT